MMKFSSCAFIFAVYVCYFVTAVPQLGQDREKRILNLGTVTDAEVQRNDEMSPDMMANGERFYPGGIETAANAGRPLQIDLSPDSPVIGRPGESTLLTFIAINRGQTPLSLRVLANDDKGFISFVQPPVFFLAPGTPAQIGVQLRIPPELTFTTQDRVELELQTNPSPSPFAVRASRAVLFNIGYQFIDDRDPPYCYYHFLSDCNSYNSEQYCGQRTWAVSVSMQDDGTGLRQMFSVPSGLQYDREFDIGTINPVKMTYRASCCFPTVDVHAVDLVGNKVTCSIDVRSVLSTGAIIGIVVGAVVLLVIIIVIIVVLVKRRRLSQKEPVTTVQQRERSHL